MKGYKVFNNDWTCRGFQFEVGKTFEEDVEPECCDRGFHFCAKASDCFNYYSFDPNNKVAEVEALGDVDTHSSDSKCSTNKLHIIREVSWQEVLELVNLGKGNTGNWNTGDYNTGNRNTGNCNTGNRNTGNRNTGDWNAGDYNTGNRNTGEGNAGDWNTGNCNTGNRNTGKGNTGDCNTGNCNTGNWNTGDWNTGNCNTGNRNTGNRNTGDWNKASRTMGCFNTENQKLKFFDEETDMTFEQWQHSDARYLLNQIAFRPIDWIQSDDMTDEEKATHPEHKTTGGYLKIRDNTDCCTEWWNNLSEGNKSIIFKIPNFDLNKFSAITGIPIELLKK